MTSEIDALLQRVLEHPPVGLLCDIDGTLSPIAPTPAEATIPAGIRSALGVLARRLALVAAISGRAASDAAALLALPDLVVVGNHGLEAWLDGKPYPQPAALPYERAIEEVLFAAAWEFPLPGIVWENKGVTASVHYRLAANPEMVEPQLGDILGRLCSARGLKLTRGRMVWEVRPPLDSDKGSAVRRLIEQYNLHGVLYLGDDRTDVDAFRAVHGAGQPGLSVGVLATETPNEVREGADLLVEGVAGVEQLLDRLVEFTAAQGD